MRYNGGKHACRNELCKIINAQNPLTYWEPFCGACNIVSGVNALYRFATDKEVCLIEMFKALTVGWIPPRSVTEDEYREGRVLPDTDPMKAFLKYGCSFGGKPWGGFARSKDRNYAENAHNSLMKQLKSIQYVTFASGDHTELQDLIGEVDLIYCDPPYENTARCGCAGVGQFDSDGFWDWARDRSELVLVSELVAPDDFVEIWSKKLADGLGTKKLTEKLFVHESKQNWIKEKHNGNE